jgi:hypothetical protein
MARFNNPLDHLKISAPCSADWDAMTGNDHVRFCGQCQLNVYNLSGMTRAEAEHLIMNTSGRLCARFYRRADGSIITQNCPVGLRRLKQRVGRATTALFSALAGLLSGLGLNYAGSNLFPPLRPPVSTMGKLVAEPPRLQQAGTMGLVRRPVMEKISPVNRPKQNK